jgi:AraC-like DNA-binding protein
VTTVAATLQRKAYKGRMAGSPDKKTKKNDMPMMQMLWVDLTVSVKNGDIPPGLKTHCEAVYCSSQEQLDRILAQQRIDLICFDFDYPDRAGLRLLRDAKARYASKPVIMFTVQHSEALAIWAFRNKVWDYLVKPVPQSEMQRCMSTLLRVLSEQRSQTPRTAAVHGQKIPEEIAYTPKLQEAVLAPAIFYVEKHFHAKIRSEDVAKLCGLSPFRFSRAFKESFGMTFRDYLVAYRLRQACRLLENPAVSVTDVAFAVGFNDASYFTRMFKQRTGVAPSALVGQSSVSAAGTLSSVHSAMDLLPKLPDLMH